MHHYGGAPPPPPGYPGRRRCSSPSDSRLGARDGRSRTQERRTHTRRFRSSDPVGNDRQITRPGFVGTNKRDFENSQIENSQGAESLLVREVEELRGRQVQMEKTMK